MDEHKEDDILGPATGSEHVGGDEGVKAKNIDSVTSEVEVLGQVHVVGSFSKEVKEEASESCNGVDITGGVAGSDIYVDAAPVQRFGDGATGGNLNKEVTGGRGGSIKVGLERDGKKLDGGLGELGNDSEVGAPSVVAEFKVGKLVESGEGGSKANGGFDDKVSLEVGDTHGVEIGSGVESSSVGEGSADGETQAVAVESVEEGGLAKEEGLERCEIYVAEDVGSREAGPSENEAHDQNLENGTESRSRAGGSSVCGTQDDANKSELVLAAIKQAEETDGGGDALKGLEIKEGEVLEVQKPGTKTACVISTIVKGSSEDTEVVEGGTTTMAGKESLDPMVDAPQTNAWEGTPGCIKSEETPRDTASARIISRSEGDSISIEKDGIVEKASNSLDEQTQVAVQRTVTPIDDEDVACPNIEGMDTDAFNENFCFSVEELQATGEAMNGSTENHYDAFADPQSLYQPTQVVVAREAASSQYKELLDSAKTQKLLVEECLDQSMAGDSAQIPSVVQSDKQVGIQVPEAEQAGLWRDQEPEKQEKKEVMDESAEDLSYVSVDSATSCKSTKAVVGDKIDDNEQLKTEKMIGEMETDTQAAVMNNDKALICNAKVQDHSDRQLKTEECVDRNAECDPAQVDSKVGQRMLCQEQVIDAKELGGEDTKVEEHNSEIETVCVNTKADKPLMDGMENAITSNLASLNPKLGLKGPADMNQQLMVKEDSDKSAACELAELDSNAGQEMMVDEHVDLHEGPEIGVEEDTDAEHPRISEEKSVKWAALRHGGSPKGHQVSYQLLPDNEDEFSVSDMVWGKVRSHPWWPGQIFDPSDASEKAMKYHKKDCFLVAYFGDRTFAWNEASLLKPFRSHFAQAERQSNSEAFQNAVDCALEEVSRRVELGLACSCMPNDSYDEIKFQVVENTGIRQESSTRGGVDKSTGVDSFKPDKLVEYMKELAQFPAGGADRLELVIAKSQLLAFYRLKGYPQLPEFQFCGELVENADALHVEEPICENSCSAYLDEGQSSISQEIQTHRSLYHKRKHNLKDSVYPRKKERSLSELMGESWDSIDEIGSDGKTQLPSPSSGKKRKGVDSFADDLSTPEGRKTISLAKVSTPKPSFKIGECIRRVASQMTGSPSILKGSGQKLDGSSEGLGGGATDTSFQQSEDAEIKRVIVPTEHSSLDELLGQLQLAARDPLKGYSFFSIIISFFSDFRDTVIMDQHDKVGGKRRKASHCFGGFPGTFEFEDMNDTYWTDRVIQNGSEEQSSRKSRKRDNHFVPLLLDKPLGRSNSRKRHSESSYDVAEQKPVGYVDEKAPAELVMHFPVVDSVPSETNLNKMFKSFGPLKESETEIDRDTNRARVVFKKCSDAEAAYSSAPKFNIFGSMLVNYQLNYTVSVPFKTPPIAIAHDEEDATLFLQF